MHQIKKQNDIEQKSIYSFNHLKVNNTFLCLLTTYKIMDLFLSMKYCIPLSYTYILKLMLLLKDRFRDDNNFVNLIKYLEKKISLTCPDQALQFYQIPQLSLTFDAFDIIHPNFQVYIHPVMASTFSNSFWGVETSPRDLKNYRRYDNEICTRCWYTYGGTKSEKFF